MLGDRKQTTTIVAVDPDVDRNGVACLDLESGQMSVRSLTFPETLDFFLSLRGRGGVAVVIEAGWLNRSHWHIRGSESRQNAAAKGNAVGRNHEVGRKLAEMCGHWDIPCRLVRPLRKMWRGKDGKITATELAALTGFRGRTNQEGRDAALLAWAYSRQ